MRYVSIDIETTGTDSNLDEILTIGIVIEDTNDIKPINELSSLHLVIIRDRLMGDVVALNMNKDIIELLKEYQVSDEEGRELLAKEHNVVFVHEYEVVSEIFKFLYINNVIGDTKWFLNAHVKMKDGHMIPVRGQNSKPVTLNVAGKNFGTFDKLFLERLPNWLRTFKIHQRILDPAMLFVDWKEDTLLPNLNTCMERAGVEGEVTHDAVDDAKDVIKVLRTKYAVTD